VSVINVFALKLVLIKIIVIWSVDCDAFATVPVSTLRRYLCLRLKFQKIQ